MDNWLFYALLFPALFGVVNIIDDNFLRKVYRSSYFGAIISGFFGMFPLLGVFYFPIQIASASTILVGVLAGFLTVIYYLFYFKALEKEYPSVVIALFNLTPIFALIIAFLFLGEILTFYHFLGFGLILGASTILSIGKVNKKLSVSKGLVPVLIASFLYSVVGVLGKYLYNQVDFVSGYMYFAVGMGLGGLFLSLVPKEGRKFYTEFGKSFKKWIIVFVLIELIGITAEVVNNLAISKGPVSLVKVVEGVQPIYVLIYALILFPFFPRFSREATSGGMMKKIVCMVVMITGLYFVSS